MKAIIDPDLEQLARINASIAAIEARPAAERHRSESLLHALHNERTDIMRYTRRAGPRRLPPFGQDRLAAAD
jgi:hypothetical protein